MVLEVALVADCSRTNNFRQFSRRRPCLLRVVSAALRIFARVERHNQRLIFLLAIRLAIPLILLFCLLEEIDFVSQHQA